MATPLANGARAFGRAQSGFDQMQLAGRPWYQSGMETEGSSSSPAHGIDPSKCRVHELGSIDWIECLERDADKCSHALFFGSGFLCRHPDQKNLLARLRSHRPAQPPA